MAHIPQEILTSIAWQVSSIEDLRAFRCVCSAWARAGYVALGHHLAVLNTEESLQRIIQFLSVAPSSRVFTKELSIYHCEWPVCQKHNWETHPLLFGGKDLWAPTGSSLCEVVDAAFSEYRNFIDIEGKRTADSDLKNFTNVLEMLPSLTTLRITYVPNWAWMATGKPQYKALMKKIWLRPSFRGHTKEAVQRILPTLNLFPLITHLRLDNSFQPYDPKLSVEHVQSLCIKEMEINPRERLSAVAFIAAFRNLRHIYISFKMASPTVLPISRAVLPYLQAARFDNVFCSENDLLSFLVKQPPAARFTFTNITMVQGTWDSFRQRLRRFHLTLVEHS